MMRGPPATGGDIVSRIPMVRQLSLVRFVPVLVVAFGLAFGGAAVDADWGYELGLAAFVLWLLAGRWLVARHHRRGIRRVKAGDFAAAIPEFEASHAFFTRHAWVDRWRFLTMLSVSLPSYREIALCNAAFCHAQLGNGAESRRFYERALESFPDSGLASAGLSMLRAGASS